jgi:hypothetical protein
MCVDLNSLVFILNFSSQLFIASKLAFSLREATAGTLPAVFTAVSSAKAADVVLVRFLVCGEK